MWDGVRGRRGEEGGKEGGGWSEGEEEEKMGAVGEGGR